LFGTKCTDKSNHFAIFFLTPRSQVPNDGAAESGTLLCTKNQSVAGVIVLYIVTCLFAASGRLRGASAPSIFGFGC
jgi:hypothetical protein